jgi:hypothetical protein
MPMATRPVGVTTKHRGGQAPPEEVAYEESTDENALTGMTTKADILEFVRWSVQAWCPQYAAELPN